MIGEPAQASTKWGRVCSFFREELKPQPGRLKGALIRVAGTVLAMWVGLAFNLPELGAVLCLAFFGSTRDKALSKKVAIGVPPSVLVILLLITFFLNVFGATPLVRTIAFLVLIFSCLYLIQAAQTGAIFLMVGIFGKLFLTFWDNGYPVVVLQDIQWWVIDDLAVAGLCALFVSSVFGDPEKDPVAEFRSGLAAQFDLLARFLTDPAESSENDDEKLREQAVSARDTLLPALEAAKKKDDGIKSRYEEFAALIRCSILLLHQSVVLRTYSLDARLESREALRWIGGRCKAIARAVQSGDLPASPQDRPHPTEDPLVLTMISTLDLSENLLAGRVRPPADNEKAASKGFFKADAFSNPAYLTNALKATAAAFTCYFFMAASDWDSIGTAVTTCLITALTSRFETRQKQSLRFAGALAGGILGVIVIAYVLPGGMGLTGLSICTAIATFLGAWIYDGGQRLSYAGVQLAICFFLGVFGGNGTPTSLVTLRDRVLGILIGNIAMWLFYDGIQPVWTADSTRNAFARALVALGNLAGMQSGNSETKEEVRCRLAERKAFLDASSEITEMSDEDNLDLASDQQRKTAPQIRRTENELQQLFSFEFVAAETKLLRLPQIQGGASMRELSPPLLSLASLIQGGNLIRTAHPQPVQHALACGEVLLARIKTEFAHLYSPDNRSA